MARVHPEIYFFGGGTAEGRASMREVLGGKGAGLAEMASLKLSPTETARLRAIQKNAPVEFQKIAATLKGAEFERLEAGTPSCVPADIVAEQDIFTLPSPFCIGRSSTCCERPRISIAVTRNGDGEQNCEVLHKALLLN